MKTKAHVGIREEWLSEAISQMKSLFKSKGYEIPALRVSCGWPHSGGTSAKNRTIGQCWGTTAAEDGIPQIFISPYLGTGDVDEMGVLATLVHEVAHAVVGVEHGHKKPFNLCARAVGLEGKLTSTHAGKELTDVLTTWSKCLGPYPHAKLDLSKSPVKKQSTRMIKMECGDCGYVARTSQKWIDEVGPAHCPSHGEMKVCLSATKGDE